ncbi:ImmA/IrrE family metallo-endopeptidase [Rhodopseudomonas sp. AAP120]|uniref:ImmA/IrrE family metallo-endopeptidase n=1 Tax=Rhodopseudomonas sp. AAP120 TaxID=1523430 RepID=UPI0009EAF4D8|nr:ImmA/IrrE family metallo-endopeptidase [Rhodopseudomonas sp. AAP120]
MIYSSPSSCGLSKAVVDDFASKVAAHLGYNVGGPLVPIVEKIGGKVQVQDILDFSNPPSGSIRIDGVGRFSIFLASHTGPARDRFTIAHELGHYFLHYLYPKQNGAELQAMEAQRYGSGPVEWEANWFAAGFLMPVPEFTERYKKLNGSVALLADAFGVSTEAARIRAEFAGLSS